MSKHLAIPVDQQGLSICDPVHSLRVGQQFWILQRVGHQTLVSLLKGYMLIKGQVSLLFVFLTILEQRLWDFHLLILLATRSHNEEQSI